MRRRGIGIVLGGPFNSGILASGPVPGAYYNYDLAPQAILDRVAAIQRICEADGIALHEAALRFPLLHPSVVSVIPGAGSPAEVASSQRALAKAIPARLWQDLKANGLLRADAPVAVEAVTLKTHLSGEMT